MKARATPAALPQHLRATYDLLHSAFPQGIDGDTYVPLLALLGEHLSDRNLAEVVACAFDIDYERALNDVYSARSTAAPSVEAMAKIERLLLPYGYENWLQEQ